MSDGQPHLLRIYKIIHIHPMFLLGRHVTQLHFRLLPISVLYSIVPMSGSLTFRPKIRYPRPVQLDYTHRGSCFPQVRVRQEFATPTVAVRYDPLCTLLQGTQTWRIGTHTRGGVEGLVGGYQ